jgi:hypothetical protein
MRIGIREWEASAMERAVEHDTGSDGQALRPFRWDKDTPELGEQVRKAVADWRQQHPQGQYGAMVSALWPHFPYQEFDVVLRGFLTAVDRHDARVATGGAR